MSHTRDNLSQCMYIYLVRGNGWLRISLFGLEHGCIGALVHWAAGWMGALHRLKKG